MKFIIENEDGFTYEKVLKIEPTKHYYGESYIKYGCPVCEAAGLIHQVHFSDKNCPNCGVNLFWNDEGD